MTRSKYILPTFITILMTSSVAQSSEEILFCTKDIDALQSIASSNHHNQGTTASMNVSGSLENDQHTALNARHCFLALAYVERQENGFLLLSDLSTRGYGSSNAPHNDGSSKTGNAGIEENLEKKVVSCVSILNGSMLAKQNEAKQLNETIFNRWAIVLQATSKSARERDYHTIDYNCCTVAYKAAQKAGANLTHVNPTGFNFGGMGIAWNTTTITESVLLSSSPSSSFMTKEIKFSEPKEEKKTDL